jgi:hypothetical protein
MNETTQHPHDHVSTLPEAWLKSAPRTRSLSPEVLVAVRQRITAVSVSERTVIERRAAETLAGLFLEKWRNN